MLITDIETDNLLEKVSKFHTAWIYDTRTEVYTGYRPNDFQQYLNDLQTGIDNDELLVFHNGIKYDSPVLTKLNKSFSIPKENILDTMVLSRLIYTDLYPSDMSMVKRGILPSRRIASHALEAWGYRLGEMKGEYKDDFIENCKATGETYVAGDEWLAFSEPMYDYCKQDVVVTFKLLQKLLSHKWYFKSDINWIDLKASEFWSLSLPCVKLEHDCATLIAKQERNGFPFNYEFAQDIEADLLMEQSKILVDLRNEFGSWIRARKTPSCVYFKNPRTGLPLQSYPHVVYPKVGKVGGKSLYVKDCPYTPIEYIEFNPASRDHIQKVLLDAGWQPTEQTPNGAWKVDEEILGNVHLEDPVAQSKVALITKYLTIQKRLGMLKSWLSLCAEDGAIHGSINTNGAATGRATHSNPNLGQVTSATFDKATHKPLWGEAGKWGSECRYVFGAEWHNDWWQVGTDASGLELRCLAHFLYPFDNGEYANEIVSGDIHTKNQLAAGLPTRDDAKTFNKMGVYKPI